MTGWSWACALGQLALSLVNHCLLFHTAPWASALPRQRMEAGRASRPLGGLSQCGKRRLLPRWWGWGPGGGMSELCREPWGSSGAFRVGCGTLPAGAPSSLCQGHHPLCLSDHSPPLLSEASSLGSRAQRKSILIGVRFEKRILSCHISKQGMSQFISHCSHSPWGVREP